MAYEGDIPWYSRALDFEALAGLCRDELAPYKVPEIWTQVDALPVNAMGKVDRTRLTGLAVAPVPLKRLGDPSEIASAVRFIFDNDYFTGRCIDVDGGLRI